MKNFQQVPNLQRYWLCQYVLSQHYCKNLSLAQNFYISLECKVIKVWSDLFSLKDLILNATKRSIHTEQKTFPFINVLSNLTEWFEVDHFMKYTKATLIACKKSFM